MQAEQIFSVQVGDDHKVYSYAEKATSVFYYCWNLHIESHSWAKSPSSHSQAVQGFFMETMKYIYITYEQAYKVV